MLRMLEGTTARPDEVVAVVPPDLVECTVEKVAVNAVMAGCRPEYLPVVLAAVEAACTDEFNMHGLLATTWFAGPVIVVERPDRAGDRHEQRRQRARARATAPTPRSAGRCSSSSATSAAAGPAGSTGPRSGSPGKLSFCFAEDEEGSPWEPLSVAPRARARASTR